MAAGCTVGGGNDVVVGWLNSPTRCADTMNPRYGETSVSYVINDNMKDNRVFTQDFGSEEGTAALGRMLA